MCQDPNDQSTAAKACRDEFATSNGYGNCCGGNTTTGYTSTQETTTGYTSTQETTTGGTSTTTTGGTSTTTTGGYCCDFCADNFNLNPEDPTDESGCVYNNGPSWCPFTSACNYGGPIPSGACNSGCAMSYKFSCECPEGCYYDAEKCYKNGTTNLCTNSC